MHDEGVVNKIREGAINITDIGLTTGEQILELQRIEEVNKR